MRFKILIILLLLSSASLALDINPKAVESLQLKIAQSGTMDIIGSISSMNLTMYIPQEGIESISVEAGSWTFIRDEFDNRLLLLKWDNPSGRVHYRVETVVKSNAKHLYSSDYSKGIGNDFLYLKETNSIVFNNDIRKLAYPFELSLEKAASLTILVNEIIEYDESLRRERKPSDWVLANKRGVCVEFSNLLTAILRVNGIPTRYVSGYSYSDIDKKFTGHAWVEVLLDDGSWVAFDPTWHEGGYLDATHIKLASLLDSNQTEVLSYKGSGEIKWGKNEDDFQIIDYQSRNITSISLESRDFSVNEHGFLKADINSDECLISTVRVSSCVDDDGKKLFNIYDNERKFFFCEEKELYWVFDIAEGPAFYCPVLVYDQVGSKAEYRVKVQGTKELKDIFISGPTTVGINEKFQLESSTDEFLFFSPDFGKSDEKKWTLSINTPGNYMFYLYSNGALAKKDITAKEEKEFSLALVIPSNVTTGSSFLAEITVKNLLRGEKKAVIRVGFDEQLKEDEIIFLPGESKLFTYNFSANEPGLGKLTISVLSDTITSHSTSLLVYKEMSWLDEFLDKIVKFFERLAKWVVDFFSNIL